MNGINKSTILSLLEKKYGTIIEETDRNEMKNDSIAEIKERLPLLLANRVRDLKRIKQINLEIMRGDFLYVYTFLPFRQSFINFV